MKNLRPSCPKSSRSSAEAWPDEVLDAALTVFVEKGFAARKAAQAQVNQLTAQVEVAELPARNAKQVAVEVNLIAAEADARRDALDLADRQIKAPIDGLVGACSLTTGEIAGATPVASMLAG